MEDLNTQVVLKQRFEIMMHNRFPIDLTVASVIKLTQVLHKICLLESAESLQPNVNGTGLRLSASVL